MSDDGPGILLLIILIALAIGAEREREQRRDDDRRLSRRYTPDPFFDPHLDGPPRVQREPLRSGYWKTNEGRE